MGLCVEVHKNLAAINMLKNNQISGYIGYFLGFVEGPLWSQIGPPLFQMGDLLILEADKVGLV